MKKIIFLFTLVIILFSCEDKQKNKNETVNDIEISNDTDEGQTDLSSNDLEKATEDLTKLLSFGTEDQENLLPEKNELEDIFSSSSLLDLLEANGVSREEMERLINNPDSLKILAQKAIKEREQAKQDEPVIKGKLSKTQLTSKETPTGVSLEEAILLVQAESGPEATMAKLKKIDSLAGTNVMSQLDLKNAQYVFNDIERKNEPKASAEEIEKMEKLKLLSGQMHSEKEAKELLAKLEKMEKDIKSGALKVSPQYQRAIKYQKSRVKIYGGSIIKSLKWRRKNLNNSTPTYILEKKLDKLI